MPTYYEMLQVSTEATTADIESAIEKSYNEWRRLVTHHDPAVVNQANQALQTLEAIRGTLTDPSKRSAYDAGIGIGAVAGLADPAAVMRAAAPLAPPRRPPDQAVNQPATQRVDAWICPQCHRANTIGTRFCKQCGHALGRDCPKCGRLTEISVPFCSECGVNIEKYAREVQTRLVEIEQETALLDKRLTQIKSQEQLRTQNGLGPLLLVICSFVFGCPAVTFLSSPQSGQGLGIFLCLASIGFGAWAWYILDRQRRAVRQQRLANEESGAQANAIQTSIRLLAEERDKLKSH